MRKTSFSFPVKPSRRHKPPERPVVVEGEHLTYTTLAERLGIKVGATRDRVRKLKIHGKPLTWNGLCRPGDSKPENQGT